MSSGSGSLRTRRGRGGIPRQDDRRSDPQAARPLVIEERSSGGRGLFEKMARAGLRYPGTGRGRGERSAPETRRTPEGAAWRCRVEGRESAFRLTGGARDGGDRTFRRTCPRLTRARDQWDYTADRRPRGLMMIVQRTSMATQSAVRRWCGGDPEVARSRRHPTPR